MTTKKEASTAVMGADLIEAALRQCEELDDAQPVSEASPRPGGLVDQATRETQLPASATSRIYEPTRPLSEVPWHRLDYRLGYLLRHVDGQRSAEELIAVSGLEPRDAEVLLMQLLDEGWIRERGQPEP